MSRTEHSNDSQEEWSEEKKSLYKKLSSVFGSTTALDFINPKTYETRQQTTIEDLLELNSEEPKERLERLRVTDHYQTTTQSLARADLEASYQAFVRDQVGRHYNRDDLELFVRNTTDIDAAKRYLDSAIDVRVKPTQSDLLFRSSKLNEEQAHLHSKTTDTRLRRINEDPSLGKFFNERFLATPEKRFPVQEKKRVDVSPELIKVERGDKKYRIKFVRTSSGFQSLIERSRQTFSEQNRRLIEQKNLESLLSADTSINQGRNSALNTTAIHREIFPPLSLSALKEYRPSITPALKLESTQIKTPVQPQKPFYKTDFIWEQSIVPSSHE